jgi:hypothetical protein
MGFFFQKLVNLLALVSFIPKVNPYKKQSVNNNEMV